MHNLVSVLVFVTDRSGETRSIDREYPLSRRDISCLISRISKTDLKAGIRLGMRDVHRLYRERPAAQYFGLLRHADPVGLLLDLSGDCGCVEC
jgi:hypothetical protein